MGCTAKLIGSRFWVLGSGFKYYNNFKLFIILIKMHNIHTHPFGEKRYINDEDITRLIRAGCMSFHPDR